MKIDFSKQQVDSLKSILAKVDTKAVDPSYTNMVDRLTLEKRGSDSFETVMIEETEVYTLIEALNNYREDFEDAHGVSDEDKEVATGIAEFIEEATGLSL
jgi:hypothetical protein